MSGLIFASREDDDEDEEDDDQAQEDAFYANLSQSLEEKYDKELTI